MHCFYVLNENGDKIYTPIKKLELGGQTLLPILHYTLFDQFAFWSDTKLLSSLYQLVEITFPKKKGETGERKD